MGLGVRPPPHRPPHPTSAHYLRFQHVGCENRGNQERKPLRAPPGRVQDLWYYVGKSIFGSSEEKTTGFLRR